jgi:hypothetical protein
MCLEKPVLLKHCPNTQEKLWCDDGPKIRTPTITTTPPRIHHAEIRLGNGVAEISSVTEHPFFSMGYGSSIDGPILCQAQSRVNRLTRTVLAPG